MLFNSIGFLVFFPVVTLIYLLIPKQLRCVWLLAASYYFYMSWNAKYAVLLLVSTVITYISGILIEKIDTKRGRQCVAAASLVSNLAILAVFKYAGFALRMFSFLTDHMGFGTIDYKIDLLLPVGISFYTFQALSYTMDVYRGNMQAERNFIRYALFVSFYPQLVAGPIERSGNLLTQIQKAQERKLWDFARIRDGLLLMCWGMFQKLVIADRASILVNQVYGNCRNYGFLELSAASVLFAFQIYCDFGGYSSIACGAAKVMGFSLSTNFRQPYLAVNIKDFWRRWHISLTSWFTDYLYIPLGGSRKGKYLKYVNILIVFLVSGLWHGAGWHFVAWGFIHAVYQIVGQWKLELEERVFKQDVPALSFSQKLGKMMGTFLLVDAAWVFFAADSLRQVYAVFRQMLTAFQKAGIYELGLDRGNWFILWFGIAVLLTVDVLHEKGYSIFMLVRRQTVWFRWNLYLGLIWCTILFGIYGAGYDAGQFLYFQF